MRKRRKTETVYGWGINDTESPIFVSAVRDGVRRVEWRCPYYTKWCAMLQRCFDFRFQENHPHYKGCKVSDEWKYFSNFKRWVDEQPNRDWENCALDKDLLLNNNRTYGQNTSVFISSKLNSFVAVDFKNRQNMIGVSIDKRKIKKYQARCENPFNKKNRFLGYYLTELEAHKVWQAKKHEYACQLADLQEDPRVAKALRERYAPDKDWTKLALMERNK